MQKIKEKSNEELVEIVETPENYQTTFYEAACEELPLRNLGDSVLYKIAKEIYKEKIIQLLRKSYLSMDEFVLPKSKILNEAQKLAIFKKEFRANQDRRRDLDRGVDNYII